jgi:uncharacterized protein
MRIEDRFTVSVPVEEAWKILLDVERIAPCMPGAELQEIDGDDYKGVVKVKLGAITAQYKGVARFTEVDEAAHRVVIHGEGRETRGQGNAAATITATLAEADGGGTRVSIDTDLTITGKVAQFGGGVMADVSAKLLSQFAHCLEEDLVRPSSHPGDEATTTVEPTDEADLGEPAEQADGANLAEGAEPTPEAEAPRVVRSRPAEPVDLLAIAGPGVTKRALPMALVLVLVLLAVVKGRGQRWALALIGSSMVGGLVAAQRQG